MDQVKRLFYSFIYFFKKFLLSARAPVVGHINASLEGLTTIRASKAQDILTKQFDKHQNLHTSASYMFLTISRGFGFYVDLLCVIYLGFIVITFLTISLGTLNYFSLTKCLLQYPFIEKINNVTKRFKCGNKGIGNFVKERKKNLNCSYGNLIICRFEW